MADATYNRGKSLLLSGDLDFDADTIRVMLVDNTYVFNADHDFVSEVSGSELSGTGYTRPTLANVTVTLDDTNDLAYMDADDLVWSSINAGTADAMILYKFVTNDADSALLGYIDSGGFPVTTNGGDLNVTWAAAGILKIS